MIRQKFKSLNSFYNYLIVIIKSPLGINKNQFKTQSRIFSSKINRIREEIQKLILEIEKMYGNQGCSSIKISKFVVSNSLRRNGGIGQQIP